MVPRQNNTNDQQEDDWAYFFENSSNQQLMLECILEFLTDYENGSWKHHHNATIRAFVDDIDKMDDNDRKRTLARSLLTLRERLQKANQLLNPTGSLAKRLAYINMQLSKHDFGKGCLINLGELCYAKEIIPELTSEEKIAAAIQKNTAKPEWRNMYIYTDDDRYLALIRLLKNYCSYDYYFTKTVQLWSWAYHAKEIYKILDSGLHDTIDQLLISIQRELEQADQPLKPDGELVKIIKFIQSGMDYPPINLNKLCYHLSAEEIDSRKKACALRGI